MKTKLNMIGGGFQHDKCSSALNTNKYVEWVKDNSATISFHIDEAIFYPINKNKKNYAWIAESTAIVPSLVKQIFSNIEILKDNFEYLFTNDRRIICKDPNFFKFSYVSSRPWIQSLDVYKKNKLISFIGSNKTMCRGHILRQQTIKKFNNIVDHYGRGFGQKELPWTYIDDSGKIESGKMLALKNYMFSISMENDNYDDIFTEKLSDCFATGTIPIFWGTRNIVNYFDKNGIIFLEDLEDLSILNEDYYNSRIESINNNFEIIKKLDTSEDHIFINYIG